MWPESVLVQCPCSPVFQFRLLYCRFVFHLQDLWCPSVAFNLFSLLLYVGIRFRLLMFVIDTYFRIYIPTGSYHGYVKCCRDFISLSSPLVAKQEVVSFRFIGFIMPKWSTTYHRQPKLWICHWQHICKT